MEIQNQTEGVQANMANVTRTLYGRQGDVGFIQQPIPFGAQRISLRPFALGEVTNHSHRIAVADETGVEMYELDGATYLRVTKDGNVAIVHEDHDPQGTTCILPAGWEGEVVIAAEYTPEAIRSVVD